MSSIDDQGDDGDGAPSSSSSLKPDIDYQKYSSLFVFSGGNKAGMEAMDKDKQAEVIYEMSKNSSFFKRAKKLDEEAEKRAEQLQKAFKSLNGAELNRMEIVAQNKLLEFEKRRSFDRICCVLDMDMFYAAVEIRDRPELKDLPVAVGGDAMISTSNYVARKYGVRAAMPGFIAKKLCPKLVFVHCNFDKYTAVAEQIRAVIAKSDPHFHSHSLDEVYFDLTCAAKARYQLLHGAPDQSNESHTIAALRPIAMDILQEIRHEITTITNGLTCSAGLAHNFFLAKICADVNKPNGQYELPARREQVMDFLTNLPTRKVGGIGKVMEKILDKLGMKTVGDIRQYIPQILHAFKPASSEFLTRVSIGIAEEEGREVLPSIPEGAVTRKSIGCERTYSARGISDRAELYRRLHEICMNVHESMVSENLRGRAVTVKVKDVEFHLHTRCQTSRTFIQSCESIESIAKGILDSFLPIKVRLLGVSVSKFENAHGNTANHPPLQRNSLTSFLSGKSSSSRNSGSDYNGRGNSSGDDHINSHASCDVIDLLNDSDDNDSNNTFIDNNTIDDYTDNENNHRCEYLFQVGNVEENPQKHQLTHEVKRDAEEDLNFNDNYMHFFHEDAHRNTSSSSSSSNKNNYSCSNVSADNKNAGETISCNSDRIDDSQEIICIDINEGDTVNSNSSLSEDKPVVCCPICSENLTGKNMVNINTHINRCLLPASTALVGTKRKFSDSVVSNSVPLIDIHNEKSKQKSKSNSSSIEHFFARK